MKYTQSLAPILSKTTLAREIYDYKIYCPDIAAIAQAGQFVNIKADGFTLRRPISIAGIDKQKGTLRLIFEVRGNGTRAISSLNEGETLDIIAPLGKGFDLNYNTAIIVGGGIGTPPLLPVAQKYGTSCTVITGFKSAANVILQDDFAAAGADTTLCTDDGSAGAKGFVTDALREVLTAKKPDIIYACGSKGMLAGVVKIAREHDIKCLVSMEERMACGVGACLVCACKVTERFSVPDSNNPFPIKYAHVCKDGPVFDAEEVVWE